MKINGYELALSEADLKEKLEKQTTKIELISPDFEGYKALSDGDKKALHHLVNAAKILNKVFLVQDHSLNLAQKQGLEAAAPESEYAALALRFFNSFNGVEGLNGIDKDPVELFVGIKGFKGRNFYPEDLGVDEFHEIFIKMLEAGKIEEVRKILSARTMVRRSGNELKAIDYTEFFAAEFSEIANQLELAAHYTDDAAFKDYLGWQAQALLQNNEDMDMLADKHWAVLQETPLEFTLSRENYEDEMTPTVFDNPVLAELLEQHQIEATSKDMLGIRAGIVNKAGTELILKFKEHMSELAERMPYKEKYHQNIGAGTELKQTMVDVDLAALSGDYAAVRGGITTAQNLPNNDKLSVKTGGGRRNVYHRQVRQSVDREKMRKIMDKLVSPDLHKLYNPEADHIFVIGHENGHSLGPDSSYQDALGLYKHIIEEHKADVISIAFMPEYVKNGTISADTLKEIYASWVIGRLFLTAQPQYAQAHRMADLIQFNYLLNNHVISFDNNHKLHISFDDFASVMNRLLEETIAVQLSKSPAAAKEFIDRYTVWSETSAYIASEIQKLGVKPYKEIRMYF